MLGSAGIALIAAAAVGDAKPKFYPDDPLTKEVAPVNVENPKPRKLSDYYDFFVHNFTDPQEEQPDSGEPIRAKSTNTVDEVPNGSWYNNRHYYQRMSIEELKRGPGDQTPPSPDGPWRVLSAKSEGVTPGFLIQDQKGDRYFLKFDPFSNPEMATGADVIGSKFFYALGYHTPENYLVSFDESRLEVDDKARVKDKEGLERPMHKRDVSGILLKAPGRFDGTFRAVASRFLEGKPLGPFRYYKTRSDDPNDLIPHEHRRELRGLFVFCAWLHHEDSRAINTQDMLVTRNGVSSIRHHLIDFGSILGSASDKANSPRSGYESIFRLKPALAQVFSLGIYVPRWARADFPDIPAVGRFEYEVWEPERFQDEYPNPAFKNRLPDDTFWAAKQVMAFTDEEIAAIVSTAQYTDPRATEWITRCLIERRKKVGREYFSRVLPIDRFTVENGQLTFEDLAAKYGYPAPTPYTFEWSHFDNRTSAKTPLSGANRASVPESDGFLVADIKGSKPGQRTSVYLRKKESTWQVVGVERYW